MFLISRIIISCLLCFSHKLESLTGLFLKKISHHSFPSIFAIFFWISIFIKFFPFGIDFLFHFGFSFILESFILFQFIIEGGFDYCPSFLFYQKITKLLF